MSDHSFRFGGIARLYGKTGLERLGAAHVLVVGLGGVGSWTVEALARSGVGALTLVDLDEVCVSNVNRQLPALDSTLGRAKAEVLAERVRGIHPGCRVVPLLEFFTEESAGRLLHSPVPGMEPGAAGKTLPDFVVDAIDSVQNKCRLIALCREKGIPIVSCGGAGGRRDATQVRVVDLSRATNDRLLSDVRKRLRQAHGFPRGEKKFGVDCVWSSEPPVFPQEDGSVCAAAEVVAGPGESRRLNCDRGYGSATFVTGTFGFVAAGVVVRRIAEGITPPEWIPADRPCDGARQGARQEACSASPAGTE